MPSLKQLTCSIELGSTNTKITEYGKSYGDGHVTSYIAVPDEEINFSVHLTSSGYIAPGLAMFVYMDGQYQCNRNRRGLVVPGSRVKAEQYEVDLRVRQKETKQPDGSFLGRDWTFHGLNLVSADKVEETDDVFLDNLGTIEVIVLRCKDASLPPPAAPMTRESPSLGPEISSRSASKQASKHSAPHPEQKEASKHASSRHVHKESSAKVKNPSVKAKTASKASTKKAESEIGGLWGLFDGASDESSSVQAKSYWNDWNKRPLDTTNRHSRHLYVAPEEPLPLVPKAAARSKHVEHQVKTGRGAQYLHLCARPEYLDDMKHPYAVFTFKYRSKRVIEKKFKVKIADKGKDLKAKLADMSKDELAEELFKLRMANNPSSSTKHTNKESSTHKPASATQQQDPTWNELPTTQGNTWEMPTDKTPTKNSTSKPSSKKSTAAPSGNAPAWDTATPAWNTNSSDPTPASEHPSQAASKTPSQKTKDAPGSYPASNKDAPTKSSKAKSRKSSHRSNKAEEAEPGAGAQEWNATPVQDATAWDASPAGPADWDTPGGNVSVKWTHLRITLTFVAIILAIASLLITYFWIKSSILRALAFCYLLQSRILAFFALLKASIIAPFISLKRFVFDFFYLRWLVDSFILAKDCLISTGNVLWTCALRLKKLFVRFATLLWRLSVWIKGFAVDMASKLSSIGFSTRSFPSWGLAWLPNPHWLEWTLHVPERIQNFFFACVGWIEGFWTFVRPDGVQMVEEVIEEL